MRYYHFFFIINLYIEFDFTPLIRGTIDDNLVSVFLWGSKRKGGFREVTKEDKLFKHFQRMYSLESTQPTPMFSRSS